MEQAILFTIFGDHICGVGNNFNAFLSKGTILKKIYVYRRKKSLIKGINPRNTFLPFEKLNFQKINSLAQKFSEHIEQNFEGIAKILLEYESFEVVEDETART